jgi:farnesyl diphosphate synthase
MAQQTTLQEIEAVFPKLEAALLEHANGYKLPKQALDWYKQVSAGVVLLLLLVDLL